jgi:hypothetical protein
MRSREEAATVGKNAAVIIERLAGRLDEVTASVRQYLVAEIEELKGDAQLPELLRDSIEGNIDMIFSAIQHDIPIEHIEPPSAALEYVRRLAQHGVAPNALVRAYCLGPNPSALADPRAEQEADRDNCRRRRGALWLTTAATVVAAPPYLRLPPLSRQPRLPVRMTDITRSSTHHRLRFRRASPVT